MSEDPHTRPRKQVRAEREARFNGRRREGRAFPPDSEDTAAGSLRALY